MAEEPAPFVALCPAAGVLLGDSVVLCCLLYAFFADQFLSVSLIRRSPSARFCLLARVLVRLCFPSTGFRQFESFANGAFLIYCDAPVKLIL